MGHFGPKVIGEAAFAAQQKKEVGGGSTFGPRVRDVAPAVVAAAANVHGESVKQPPAEDSGLSIEQFVKVLDENASFLDTLYVQELERPEGPRRDCLVKARQVAIALGSREDIVAEIDELLAAGGTGPVMTGRVTREFTPEEIAAAAAEEARVKAVLAKIDEVNALDNFEALKAIAADLGLAVPKSKKAAKEAIVAHLSGPAAP